ncbi:hypothetical protein LOTGIDRAFT_229578 [Lottia gigantea]|uniref:RRM domain-containing protein n=1 Tax=Lottia gigantea TaxID=225164 RepID=V3ZNK9_LOTGI|nr:hypothetical protein LOTGIDRAFT_229578 [Lottia gigantea]ESO84060.1 hypothetical protein LOTGIDRAFT_229578 [Lottia gigantea]
MAASINDTHGKSKTLFVRNLPFTATDEQLENVFNEIGPVQRCFVVRKKGEEKCKGYGYVKFSLLEDAVKAQSKKIFLNGRRLLTHSADKKKITDDKPTKKKRKQKPDSDGEDEQIPSTEVEEERKRSNQEKKYLRSITLVVSGLTSHYTYTQVSNLFNKYLVIILTHRSLIYFSKYLVIILTYRSPIYFSKYLVIILTQVSKLLKDVKTLSKIIYPVQEVGNVHLRFKSIRDTKRAERKLNNTNINGIDIKAIQLSEHQKLPRDIKRCRLIIRNLSFKCKIDTLKQIFSKFGQVVEVNIPTKEDGKMKGFGFVQLGDLVSADKAVKAMNGQNILGRPVAVDWALSIDHYKQALQQQKQQTEGDGDQDKDADDEDEEMLEKEDYKDASDNSDGDDNSDAENDNEGETSSEEEIDEENEDSEESDEGFDDSKSEIEEVSDDEDDDEEDDDDSSIEADEVKKEKGSKKTESSDVNEGKTVFMRNVSFDTTEDKLLEVLNEYGDVKYCKIVRDALSLHSKGTAFAQFRATEMAKNLIEEAAKEKENEGVLVDGRKLLITLAVDRKKAEEYRQKEDEKKQKKDKRNLYLIREGYIRPGTEAAKSLEKSDVNKRLRIEAQKRQKLKNPSVFVSATRLCVHNLPTTIDDSKLRQLLVKLVNDKSSKITECRVMRDLDRVNSQGVAKSRGYAFVEFTKHEHALKALRETNNNPDLFGDKRRLIVEFSLENKQALLAKQKRLDRQKAKQESLRRAKDKAEKGSLMSDIKQKTKKTDKPNKIKQNLDNVEKESRVAKKLYSGPVGFPKHFGPKVRHKARPTVNTSRNSKQIKQVAGNKRKPAHSDVEPIKKRRRQAGEIRDDFDQLINKYKKKLMSEKSQTSRNQWLS